jgi:hypothetical protein
MEDFEMHAKMEAKRRFLALPKPNFMKFHEVTQFHEIS